jgi:hypothetical protein
MRSPPGIISVRVPRSGLVSSMEAKNPSALCNKSQIGHHSIHYGRRQPLSQQGRGCGFKEVSAIAIRRYGVKVWSRRLYPPTIIVRACAARHENDVFVRGIGKLAAVPTAPWMSKF